MSEAGDNIEQPSPLQFETVEGARSAASTCAGCSTPLVSEYHELNGHVVCADCRSREEALHRQDAQSSRFLTAALYGFGAAIGGGLLYWGFVKLTNIEFGLMAIAVGWLVGRAVMKGSNMRGGRHYQILAVALTYFSITFSYGALMIEALVKSPPPTASTRGAKGSGDEAASPGVAKRTTGIAMLVLIVLASPFLGGFSNIIGLLIIAIGLFEAWKQARPAPFATSGPFPLGRGVAAAAAE